MLLNWAFLRAEETIEGENKMTKASKSLTLILTALLTVLTLFAGAFFPATVKAEEVSEESGTEIVSVLVPGVVSIRVNYKDEDGQTRHSENFSPRPDKIKDGVWDVDCYVYHDKIKESFEMYNVELIFMINLDGTAYEEFNSLTVEISSFDIRGNDPKGYLAYGEAREEEINATFSREEGFSHVIQVDDIFSSYGEGSTVSDCLFFDKEIPEAFAYFTFDVKCYVEIDKDKIIEVDPGINGEGEPEDALENKAENWLNETGDKISSFIQENTGVAIGGTSSVVVLVAIVIILIRRKRR